MIDSRREFHKRQRAVQKKHVRMARGYVTKLERNGVITQKPDVKAPARGLRVVLFLALLFLAFKSFVLASLGIEDYTLRLAKLETGSTVEQAGAWLMQLEPVSLKLAELVAPLLA